MISIKLQYLKYFIFFLTEILLIKLSSCQTASVSATTYKVYDKDNDYPRPLLLDSEYVMAFSGKPGRMSKYNKNAEPIYVDVPIDNYQSNVAVRQYLNTSDGKNRYILVDSLNGVMNIYLLNDEGVIKHSQINSLSVVSYKIDVQLLQDSNLLISYVNNLRCWTQERCIRIQKAKIKDDNSFEFFGNQVAIETDNYYISCSQSQYNSIIACQYVTTSCKEKALVLENDISSYKEFSIFDNSTDCAFNKVFWLTSNYFVFTFQQKENVLYSLKKINNKNDISDGPYEFSNPQLNHCQKNSMKTDSTKFNETTFILSCVTDDNSDYQKDLGHIAIETFDISTGTITIRKQLITKFTRVNFPFVSRFSGTFISLFYNLNNSNIVANVFEILYYPSCSDYEAGRIYINSQTEIFSLENYITEGSGTSGTTLLVYFPEELSATDGVLKRVVYDENGKIKENITVVKNNEFPLNTKYFYTSAFKYGKLTVKYAGKTEGNIGRYCWLVFNVTDCYEGCYTCSQKGDYYHQYCYGCNDLNGYYPIFDDKGKEVNRETPVSCYDSNNETALEKYYYDENSHSFKPCQSSCKYCKGEGDAQNQTCVECLSDYYPQEIEGHENDPGNCYDETHVPDNYFLDTDGKIKVCDVSCAKCSGSSTECTECNTDYYKIENDEKTCSKDKPGDNYYFDDVNNMWKLCYETCATCSSGATTADNNCDTCLENYYKKEVNGELTNICIKEKPSHYYFDSTGDSGKGTYRECFEKCKECSGAATEASMNCEGCANLYYPLSDYPHECYNEAPNNYYYNSINKRYEHCNTACKKCSEPSTIASDTKCESKECSDGYSYLSDNFTVCYKDNNKIPYYNLVENGDDDYFEKCQTGCYYCSEGASSGCTSCDNNNHYYQKLSDKGQSTFECFYHLDTDDFYYLNIDETTNKAYLDECYTSCKTCSAAGEEGNNNCDTCKDGYYPINGEDKSCAQFEENYYLDNNVYYPCHSNCKTCETSGTDEENNCLTCKNGMEAQPISSSTYFQCNGGCNIEGQYYDNRDNSTCIQCYDNRLYIDGLYCINCVNTLKKYHKIGSTECLENVPIGFYAENDGFGTVTKCPDNCETCEKLSNGVKCKTCSSKYPIFYNGDCYDNCNFIEGKPYLYNRECYSDCSSFYFLFQNEESKKCEFCPSTKKYLKKNGNECLAEIPDNGIAISDDKYDYLYEECYSNCATCSEISSNSNDQKCLTCVSDKYLRTGTTNCETTCDESNDGYYVKETSPERICVNCDNNISIESKKKLLVHYEGVNECIEKPTDGYYIIDANTGTIGHCPSNCLNCISSTICTKCSTDYVLDDGVCKTSCTNSKYGILNGECVNCKTKNKFNVNNNCVDSVPDDYVITDDTTGYAEPCDEKCASCLISKTQCTSCKSPYFEQYNSRDGSTGEVQCENNCGNYLVKDISTQKCINCQDLSTNKYFLNNECVNKDSNTNINYYISQVDGEKEYGVLKQCHSNCASCHQGPISEEQNCDSCSGSRGLLGTNCVTSCEPKHVMKNNICVNCKEQKDSNNYPMYKYNDQCISSSDLPANAIISDYDYNIVSDCDSPCLTCSISGTTQICLTCIAGYYLQPDNSHKCLQNCDNFPYSVKDDSSNSCKNCKEYDMFFYNGMCVNKEPDYTNYYEVTDVTQKARFGVIEKCNNNCTLCSKGEEKFSNGTIKNMNCDVCISTLYHEALPSMNCVDDCGDLYGIDVSNPDDKKCINCKNYLGSTGNPHYKLIKENPTQAEKECQESIPDGYYISNTEYNILSKCDDSCDTCESSADHCTSCSTDYIVHPYNENKCVIQCTTEYWYVDDDNNYKCTNQCNDVKDSSRPHLGGIQCVKYCNDKHCIYCRQNHAYFESNGICVTQCPIGYFAGDNGYSCTMEPIVDGECATRIDDLTNEGSITNLESMNEEWIERYMYSYNIIFTHRVDILKGNGMTLQIFKDDNCQKVSSVQNGISYVNITECKNTLMRINSLSDNEIFFLKYDIKREGMVNQVHYSAYNALTGTELDISKCGKEEISYSFNTAGVDLEKAKELHDKYGVDVFNPEDDFYNDVCFQFYDEFSHDVILKDRRNYIFQNVSLCEESCEYKGFDWDTTSIKCSCENQMASSTQVNKLTKTKGAGNFKVKTHQGSIICMKCYKLVFSWKYSSKNPGSYIVVFFILFQGGGVVYYFLISGFNRIYGFLNQFTYGIKDTEPNASLSQSNPPKRSKKKLRTKDSNFSVQFNQININEHGLKNNNSKNENEDDNEEEEYEEDGSSKNDDIKKENTQTFNSTKNNFTLKADKNSEVYSDSNPNNSIKKHSKSCLTNNLPILSNKESIEVDSNTNYNIIPNSSNVLTKKKTYVPNEDEEIESFDDDEIDYLQLNDAIDFDNRTFLYFFWRMCKKKVIFIKPFSDISVFEPFPIRITTLIFYITWYFVFSCLFFKDKFFAKRYGTKKFLSLGYILSHEIGICILSGFLSSIVGFLFDYFLSVKSKFVALIRYEKNHDQFLKKAKSEMQKYKIKLIIVLVVNCILMLFFWYYISSFCAVFPKTQAEIIAITIIAIIFGVIFQFIFALIIAGLRYVGLKYKQSIIYRISQILI